MEDDEISDQESVSFFFENYKKIISVLVLIHLSN